MADLVLVDDPIANDLFDLKGLLATGASGHLAAIAVPSQGGAGRYRIDSPGGSGAPIASREGTPEDAIGWFLERPSLPFAVIAFVSSATLPLLEALHADPRTRDLFKLGITGPRLDTPYNLARKLVRDGKIHYHEHTLTLPVVLHKRFATMLRAYADAARGA